MWVSVGGRRERRVWPVEVKMRVQVVVGWRLGFQDSGVEMRMPVEVGWRRR